MGSSPMNSLPSAELMLIGVRAVVGPMRSVVESLEAFGEEPCPPLVSRGPADAVAPTGLDETEGALLNFEDEAWRQRGSVLRVCARGSGGAIGDMLSKQLNEEEGDDISTRVASNQRWNRRGA